MLFKASMIIDTHIYDLHLVIGLRLSKHNECEEGNMLSVCYYVGCFLNAMHDNSYTN